MSFRYADKILIDDEILVQGNNGLTPAKVINVSSIVMQGHYCSCTFFLFVTERMIIYWQTICLLKYKLEFETQVMICLIQKEILLHISSYSPT